jgi:hypothetical protein
MDDYFDARHYLEDGSAKELWEHRQFCVEAFERLWDRFCEVERERDAMRTVLNRVKEAQIALELVKNSDFS